MTFPDLLEAVIPCLLTWSASKIQQVDQRHDEHPNQIYKVPIEPGGLDMACREPAFGEAAANHRQRYDTTDHMQQMQAGDAEECCAKEWRAPGILKQANAVVAQAEPLPDVQSRKNNTEENSGPQKAPGLGFVAHFR